jgi:hypothetical protein
MTRSTSRPAGRESAPRTRTAQRETAQRETAQRETVQRNEPAQHVENEPAGHNTMARRVVDVAMVPAVAAGAAVGALRHAVETVPRKQLALYAGLGLAAAVSVIDWPVAVAVAAGTEVARRAARSQR